MKYYKMFTNVEDFLEEDLEWSDKEIKEALEYNEDAENLADYLDRLDDIRTSAGELSFEDNAITYLENIGYNCAVFDMYEFNEILSDCTPIDIAKKIAWGNFNPGHNYFKIGDDGNLYSADYKDELIEELSEVVDSANNIYCTADKLIDDAFNNFNKTYGTNFNYNEIYKIRELLDHFDEVEHKQNLIDECGELLFR